MHESSLGKQVLDVILAKAAESGALRVRRVCGWIAETEHLDPDAIAFHFAAHARGTPAEGAALELELSWIEARCHGCGLRYTPDHHVLLCPDCGATEAELLGEPGIGIETMDVETA